MDISDLLEILRCFNPCRQSISQEGSIIELGCLFPRECNTWSRDGYLCATKIGLEIAITTLEKGQSLYLTLGDYRSSGILPPDVPGFMKATSPFDLAHDPNSAIWLLEETATAFIRPSEYLLDDAFSLSPRLIKGKHRLIRESAYDPEYKTWMHECGSILVAHEGEEKHSVRCPSCGTTASVRLVKAPV